jgi:hypothetical protein
VQGFVPYNSAVAAATAMQMIASVRREAEVGRPSSAMTGKMMMHLNAAMLLHDDAEVQRLHRECQACGERLMDAAEAAHSKGPCAGMAENPRDKLINLYRGQLARNTAISVPPVFKWGCEVATPPAGAPGAMCGRAPRQACDLCMLTSLCCMPLHALQQVRRDEYTCLCRSCARLLCGARSVLSCADGAHEEPELADGGGEPAHVGLVPACAKPGSGRHPERA